MLFIFLLVRLLYYKNRFSSNLVFRKKLLGFTSRVIIKCSVIIFSKFIFFYISIFNTETPIFNRKSTGNVNILFVFFFRLNRNCSAVFSVKLFLKHSNRGLITKHRGVVKCVMYMSSCVLLHNYNSYIDTAKIPKSLLSIL